jgi:hypothetical protein
MNVSRDQQSTFSNTLKKLVTLRTDGVSGNSGSRMKTTPDTRLTFNCLAHVALIIVMVNSFPKRGYDFENHQNSSSKLDMEKPLQTQAKKLLDFNFSV